MVNHKYQKCWDTQKNTIGEWLSLPFEIGDNRLITAKIVDDCGIEGLKIMEID